MANYEDGFQAPSDLQISAGKVPLWKLALMGSPLANKARGVVNSIVPGVAIDPTFSGDLYNPFTGKGRQEEMSSDAKLTESLSNVGQVVMSGGLKAGATKGAAAITKEATPAVEMLFKSKTWDQIPEAIKADPRFLEEATRKWRAMNKGKTVTKGISEIPSEIAQPVGKGAAKIAGRASSMIKGLAGKAVENPLKAKAVAAPVVAGANMINDAKGQIDNEAAAQVAQEPVDTQVTEVPTTYSDAPAQFTGLEPKQVTPAEQLKAILSGNKGLTPYQPAVKTGFAGVLDKIARTVNPVDTTTWDQEAAARDYQNQMTQKGFVDPETQALLQQFLAQQGVENQRTTQQQGDARDFGRTYAPAIKPAVNEQLQGLPAGSIDQGMMQQIATQAKTDPMMQLMMTMLTAQMAGGPSSGLTQPQLNVPKQR